MSEDKSRYEDRKRELLKEKKHMEDELHVLYEIEAGMSEEDALGELSMYDNHPADVASETFEREKNEALQKNVQAILKRIESALERLENGTYGKCDNCGERISDDRLEVLPYATTCIACQTRSERRPK